MKIEQLKWTSQQGWQSLNSDLGIKRENAQLVLVFGARDLIEKKTELNEIRSKYPQAFILGNSTAGEIHDIVVVDDSLAVTAIEFEFSWIEASTAALIDFDYDSYKVGAELTRNLPKKDLVHVFAIAAGDMINGSELVKGMSSNLPEQVKITGGLAGDGDRFEKSLIIVNEQVAVNTATTIGLYGEKLSIGYGSVGGWDAFGPERLITRAEGNKLYELDGQPALSLYKRYLGEYSNSLPSSALLFPLSIKAPGTDFNGSVVRTLLKIDEDEEAMIFAGDIPENHYAKLMKANFNRLIEGASKAGENALNLLDNTPPDLAILISCVGRKLVLKQRVDEEVESIREILSDSPIITGFYSYGEISPFSPNASCELHNQTMTITTLLEK